ncbi:MAG: hypothetical protein M3Q84_11610 [Actinomycetota bacterium]|nr:hypothetical protein [Actinomycetota bacterium]
MTQVLRAVPTPPPATDLDTEVRRYLDLAQRAEEIGAARTCGFKCTLVLACSHAYDG